MRKRRVLRTAFRALLGNPMRAALTMLGIFIGVGSFIVMMSIGRGSSVAIQRAIANMGAINLMVLPGAVSSGGVNMGTSTAVTLTPDDAEAILKCPAVRIAAPVVRARAQAEYGSKNWVPREVVGSTAAFLDIRDWSLDEGVAFSEGDVRNSNKVCLIGKTLVNELFNGQSPIGMDLRVQNVSLRVIGVLSAKGSNMMGQDQDDIVVAPWTTLKYRVSGNTGSNSTPTVAGNSSVKKINQVYPNGSLSVYPVRSATQALNTPQTVKFANIDWIMVSTRSAVSVKPAIAQITALLQERHHIREGKPEDFKVRDMAEMTSAMSTMTDTMTVLLLCLASISLIVGGVGIMNIMLVSVTERTREIGLRMAVGARPRDILRQFLIEALVLCLTGGTAGIGAGLLGSYAVQMLKGWPTETSMAAIVLALGVSGLVGVFFGFYPAWKASRMDPIDALRYD